MKKPYVVLVCGGRDYEDEGAVYTELDALNELHKITHLMHGDASGADTYGDRWAERNGVQPVACRALWRKLGNGAGPIRNEAMAMLKPNICLAFPGGRGTERMVQFATDYGISVTRCPR